MGSTLGFIGLALMLSLSGSGSAIGTVIAGSTTLGALRKKSDAFGSYMVLSALPGTQGLYGFGGFFLLLPKITDQTTIYQGSAILGAGIMLGLVGLLSAIYQGKVCAHAISAIAAGQDAFGKGMVLAVFPELYAIIAFAATFLIFGLF